MDLTLTPAAGVGEATIRETAILGIPRSLYLYENRGMWALEVFTATSGRSLYLYENKALWAISVLARAIYLYENITFVVELLSRSLYLYEATTDGEVFPWLMKIDPTEQYRGGTIDLYGDGFGEIIEVGAGATITTSSVSGGNVGGNAVDRTAAKWASTDGAAAWIRFTFGAPKTIVGVTLSDVPAVDSAAWGLPLFRFSDGGPDVVGASSPAPADVSTTEYPVGARRTHYDLPAPRTTDYVEIRVSSGGGPLTTRGFAEVWIWQDADQAAESSQVISNDGLPAEVGLGIVTWRNRSPGLWPANGGLPITKAATATVPPTAESGLVIVEELI